jgi:predicted nucleic acid-binding Zn ribbon protein
MGEIDLQKAMDDYLNQSRLKPKIQALRIEEIWEELMGKTVSKYTDTIKISGQTLFITSSVAPLKNELLFQRETIIQRVNEAFGEKVIQAVVIQ